MPPPRFSVRDIEQIIQKTGYIFIVTSDVPCHLFMRWTLEAPRTHKDPVFKRGAPFSEKIRFCFVEYLDNEQEEAGDTLSHTFIKLDWPVCQTRYFYFWGTVAGAPSPSETPLFSKHFPGVVWGVIFFETWPPVWAPPFDFEQKFLEPWDEAGFRPELIFLEPWTS